MIKEEFYFLSADESTSIYGIQWKPEGEIKGVVQICHGMVEYIDRYDEFASYLTRYGFCVIGHDQLGHGKSVQSEEDYGYFHKTKGNQYMVADIHKIRTGIAKKYPDVPYFLLGHSMGSFLVRQYLMKKGEGITGVLLLGTGHQGEFMLQLGRLVCFFLAMTNGWKYKSALVHKYGMGQFNKFYEPSDTGKDWVMANEEGLEKYVKDPLCSFLFTVNGYYHLFSGMKHLGKKRYLCRMPKELPIYFLSGADDPVGECGKGVEKVIRTFKKAGMKDITFSLYEGYRHEILNEVDRVTVYEDIRIWMESKRT